MPTATVWVVRRSPWAADAAGNGAGPVLALVFADDARGVIAHVVEIVALEDANATTKKIPVLWTAYMAGIQSSNQFNINKTVSGIYQAFEQSPYILSSVER